MTAIYDITKFTMLDYPDEIACIAWFAGCNMRCPYCYNPKIVRGKGTLKVEELMAFLKKRQGLLDGIVLSGGECTNYPHLSELCKQIKQLDYLIKIDTNGSRPDVLESLFQQKQIDYVALDFKTTENKYSGLTGLKDGYELFSKSLALCILHKVTHEVRVTIHSDLLTCEDLAEMIGDLERMGYKGKLYCQNFIESDNLGDLESSSKSVDFSKLDQHKIELRNFDI